MSSDNACSHKGEQRRSFTLTLKKRVVEYAINNSNREAARKYNIDDRRVLEWRTNINVLTDTTLKQGGGKRKRLEGGGRKIGNVDLESDLLEWIHELSANMLRVSRKLITRKAKVIHDEINEGDPAVKESFVASRGWLEEFMKRNGLSFRRRATVAQKNPSVMVDKLVTYVAQIRRLSRNFNYHPSSIIVTDETAIWSDMLAETNVDTTGKKDIPLKTTGHEKVMVPVCLTAKADGTRLKPFIVLAGAKRECKVLNEEFKARCVIASAPNAWINEELTLTYVNSIIGRLAFNRRLLSWDSFECHITNSVREVLKVFNVDNVIVPGGCTPHIQTHDVSWNKPFKAHAQVR